MIPRTVAGLKATAAKCTLAKGDRVAVTGITPAGVIFKDAPGDAAYGYYNVKLDTGRRMLVHFSELAKVAQ